MPIKTAGDRYPLFCVNGEPLKMAHLLDADQPLYGISNAYHPNFNPPPKIEQLAELYVRELQVVQPEGPYHICGFSVGGLIAFEMARQLHTKGHAIKYLALVDPVIPKPGYSRLDWVKESFSQKGQRLKALKYFSIRAFQSLGSRLHTFYRMARVRIYELMGWDLPIDLRRIRDAAPIRSSHNHYMYTPMEANCVVFHPDMPDENHQSYDEFWKGIFADNIEIVMLPGLSKHLEFLADPYFTDVTNRISEDMKARSAK